MRVGRKSAAIICQLLLIARMLAACWLITPSVPAFASAENGGDKKGSESRSADDAYLAKLAEPIKLSDSSATNHEANKTLDLNPLYLSSAVEMHSFRALRQEASFDQPIRLRDAIDYVLDRGMQIKVSREELIYQHWQTLSQIAGALPNFFMSYSLSKSDIYNAQTNAIGRQFLTGLGIPVFQGGGTTFGILSQYYREKAWRNVYKSTVQDVFLSVYQSYMKLLLQRVLLQVWAKAVETDQEQVRVDKSELLQGAGTRFAVLQSEAQLSADRQSFLNQQVAMRQAALTLNAAMNYPMAANLIPVEETLTEASLFSDKVELKTLIQDALVHHPGLRQYEQFRLVAARNLQLQAASIYPAVTFFILGQINDTGVTPAANAYALGGVATSTIASYLDSTFVGRVSNNALGQQFSFSPTNGSTSSQGANTAPSAMPAASGGIPIASIQSGSAVSSGAVAPSIFGGGTGSGASQNSNGSLQAPAGIFPGYFRSVQAGFQLNWSLANLGVSTVTNVMAAKTLARQSMLQCNQELTLVMESVRSDYLAMLSAREVIDKAAAAVAASREALRIAHVRLKGGIGTNLDVISAQKDYITNLTSQAQAIVASNIAQAQLLHDIGMINTTTLTQGYSPGIFQEANSIRRIHWVYP